MRYGFATSASKASTNPIATATVTAQSRIFRQGSGSRFTRGRLTPTEDRSDGGSVVSGEPVAHDLHVALALLDGGQVRGVVEEHPSRATDPVLQRLLQRGRRLVVQAGDEQRRHADLAEPVLRLPVADGGDHVELARALQRVVEGRVALDPGERLDDLVRPGIEPAYVTPIEDVARGHVLRIVGRAGLLVP